MTPAWIALLALTAGAGESPDAASFEVPVEIRAGESTFARILYPSPVVFDIDGDGTDELVIGDLMGHLHVSEREEAGWGRSTRVKDAGGNDLKFDNW